MAYLCKSLKYIKYCVMQLNISLRRRSLTVSLIKDALYRRSLKKGLFECYRDTKEEKRERYFRCYWCMYCFKKILNGSKVKESEIIYWINRRVYSKNSQEVDGESIQVFITIVRALYLFRAKTMYRNNSLMFRKWYD